MGWYGYSPDTNLRDTYTFDIYVFEKDKNGKEIDKFYLKWPYCLDLPHDAIMGHDDATDVDTLKCTFLKNDYCNGPNTDTVTKSLYKPSDPVDIVIMDPNLIERCKVMINTETTGNYTYNLPDDEYPGQWRALFMSKDNCWNGYRRNHLSTNTLVNNKKKHSFPYSFIIYIWPGIGHVSLGITKNYKDNPGIWSFGGWPHQHFNPIVNLKIRAVFVPVNDRNSDDMTKWDEVLYTDKGEDDSVGVKPMDTYPFMTTKAKISTALNNIRNHFLNDIGQPIFDEMLKTPNEHKRGVNDRPNFSKELDIYVERKNGILHFPNQVMEFYGSENIPAIVDNDNDIFYRNLPKMTTQVYWACQPYDCTHFADYVTEFHAAPPIPVPILPITYARLITGKHLVVGYIPGNDFALTWGHYYSLYNIQSCSCEGCKINRDTFGIK